MADKNNIITYENLYNILRKEKQNQELQELKETFYNEVMAYIEEKKEILESQQKKESIFTTIEVQKTKKQLENIFKILKELYEKRENKIIYLALLNSKTNEETNEESFMLERELELYESLKKVLDNSRNSIFDSIINGNKQKEQEDIEPKDLKVEKMPKNSKKITILKPIESFVDTNLKTRGPFKKEDMAILPEEIAELLISKNIAKEIR
ncbi:DNA replication complex GINS family protein [archaeon]|jgi:DNA replication initiation complex subunit (GINS family)|nr:DNA replication complex GINS family protein [archaeon]MBT6824154.1 DNA replication complex GINS family protein [archaeon]MBT7107002.1 DNA replication complex GINS family protein [archaeon]